ncbi:MAG: hypothetical protein BIFFINMI_02907 [Phycisphaerae bacterium]|nr:hypothetical protein [Phycisphaerae bacterium]
MKTYAIPCSFSYTLLVRPRMSPVLRRAVSLLRTLHIYLTMLALLPLAFIALTGLMLNHESWFGRNRQPIVHKQTGQFPSQSLKAPDKLAVVERLRSHFDAEGAVDSFESDENEVRVVFARPGRRTDAFIDRQTGQAEVTHEYSGVASVLTDLHKGKTAGRTWRWLIDAIAILLLVAAVTGVALWLTLPRRRWLGLAALAAGVATWLTVYFLLVP